MIEKSIGAFGVALASNDPAVRETAHYNLANAIFERAKAAETERITAYNKAKSSKERKLYALTFQYLDKVARQLENCLEHYQESLTLNSDNKDAKANMDKASALLKVVRNIRLDKEKRRDAKRSGKGGLKGNQGQSKGKGQGESESPGKSKGKGKGQGDSAGPGGDGDDDEDADGDGDEDGDGDGNADDDGDKDGGKGENGEKGEGDKDGKDGKGGKDGKDGDKEGDGAGDKSNKEFDGKLKAKGDGDGGTPGGERKKAGKNGGGGGGGAEKSREDTINDLKHLSQELPVRGRTDKVPEKRRAKDW
jgi:hypothetical protein